MQPNTKEFLAKKSTENNITGNVGISDTPAQSSDGETNDSLTFTAGPMAENGAKTMRGDSSQMNELMNDGRGDSALVNKGSGVN